MVTPDEQIERLQELLEETRAEVAALRSRLTCAACGCLMPDARMDHPALVVSSASRGDEWAWICGACERRASQDVDVDTGRCHWLQDPRVWEWMQERTRERNG